MICPKCREDMILEPKSGNYVCAQCHYSVKGFSTKTSMGNRAAGGLFTVVTTVISVWFLVLEFNGEKLTIGEQTIPYVFGIIGVGAALNALLGILGVLGLIDVQKIFSRRDELK